MKKILFLTLLFTIDFSSAKTTRKAEYPIDQIFVERWSPRAMSGESITHNEMMTLFEAARWAPSSYNGQPWRFIYAHKNGKGWDLLFNALVEFNQSWAKNAGALILVISKNTFDHNNEPAPTHTFDTGAAWANLALQGSAMDLVVHGMSGFDYNVIRKAFNIPEDYTIEAMVAVGKSAKPDVLPESMRSMETPSDRKQLSSFVFEGQFSSC
jgi:nitroreductase